MTLDIDAIEAGLPDARYEAYYYDFTPTGITPVDAILSAVAVAGKGSHHTDAWTDTDVAYYYAGRDGLVDGESAVDLIQKNAEAASSTIRTLVAEVRRLREQPYDFATSASVGPAAMGVHIDASGNVGTWWGGREGNGNRALASMLLMIAADLTEGAA